MQVLWLTFGIFLLMILLETSISIWLNFGFRKQPAEDRQVRDKEKFGYFKGKLNKRDVS